jgi:hypothetical protein
MSLASFGNSFFVAGALAGVPSSKSLRTQAKEAVDKVAAPKQIVTA